MNEHVQRILAGDRRALARLISQIEDESSAVDEVLATLYVHAGKAHIIGVTGAPGTGKSSLVNELAKAYRKRGKTVAIVAVDPTSPFSGGAILGDRIRMGDHAGDRGVFIRSMATRGSLGGLARATRETIRVIDAAGYDVILVETVGAGQSEVDIALLAHTIVVVEAPGLGDDIQAIKAGILEIADILVVNKADRPDAEKTFRTLQAMLNLGHPIPRNHLMNRHGQQILSTIETEDNAVRVSSVVKTVATTGEGIDELMGQIDEHADFLVSSGLKDLIERQQIENELLTVFADVLLQRILQQVTTQKIKKLIEQVQARQLDPRQAAKELLKLGLS